MAKILKNDNFFMFVLIFVIFCQAEKFAKKNIDVMHLKHASG